MAIREAIMHRNLMARLTLQPPSPHLDRVLMMAKKILCDRCQCHEMLAVLRMEDSSMDRHIKLLAEPHQIGSLIIRMVCLRMYGQAAWELLRISKEVIFRLWSRLLLCHHLVL